MKTTIRASRALPFLAVLALSTATSHATLHWIADANGGDGTSTYQEANWDTDGNPAAPYTTPGVDAVNPTTSIEEDIFVDSGTPGGPSGAGGTFQIGNTGSLTLTGGTFRMAAGFGIRADAASGGTKTPLTMSNDAAVLCQFFLDQDISVSDSASITLYGAGNPINNSVIDFDAAWTGTITFDAETPAAANSEHLSKMTVAGGPAVAGSDPTVQEPGDNVLIVSDGGAGSVLTVVTPTAPTLALTAVHATPTVIRTSGTVRVHWRSAAAEKIVVNAGATELAVFTTGGEGQAFIDAGFVDLAVSADTIYTVTALDTVSNESLMTSVAVLSGGDPATYAETVLGDGAVAYYQFEEAAGSSAVFDSTNNGHDSKEIAGGFARGGAGAINAALVNDGTGSVVIDLQLNPQDPDGDDTVGDVDPDDTEGWSIEAIVRPDSATSGSDQHIAANKDGSGTGRSNFFIDQDGTLQSYVGGAERPGTNSLADASWCHVVMTVELDPAALDPAAPYTLRYYIDGVLDSELTDVPIEAATGDWVFGSHKNQNSAWLFGSLDEVSIWTTTLDQATITAHYDAFIADPGVAPLLGFIIADTTIGAGSSTTLSWKLGGSATTAVITDDQGGTIVADATGSSSTSLSPTVDTIYTLTVNGTVTATVAVTVLPRIVVDAAGINAGGFFEMTVSNLQDGSTYDLFYSDALESDIWSAVAVSQTADASGILTFADTVPADPVTNAELYYRVELVP